MYIGNVGTATVYLTWQNVSKFCCIAFVVTVHINLSSFGGGGRGGGGGMKWLQQLQQLQQARVRVLAHQLATEMSVEGYCGC